MLEYSLEFLVSGGVGELFVFCCSHAAQIQAYLDSVETGSKWKRRKNLVVRTIVADCATFGDALRFLDTLDIIKNDFVLISGDVISNVKLDVVVKEHKARVAQDKRNMMTLLFKQASHSHRTRSLNDDAVLAIDPQSNQLLVYDNQRRNKYISLEKTLLVDSSANPIQLRYDLMDSHISICTPEVLMLFTDNFDWFVHPQTPLVSASVRIASAHAALIVHCADLELFVLGWFPQANVSWRFPHGRAGLRNPGQQTVHSHHASR